MTSLVVEQPGMLTTVQDLGREGYGSLGVSPSGAADPVALRLCNLLLGNDAGAAGLEMTLSGGRFLFPEGGVVCLGGADLAASVDGAPLPLWSVREMRAGQRLQLGGTRDYARCYLCVAGGIAVEKFLGSASTHLLSGLGGWQGRALKKGDVLPLGPANEGRAARKIKPEILETLRPRRVFRVTRGPQAEWFSPQAFVALLNSEFVVTEESNRMGLRLEGAPLAMVRGGELISEGAPLGAVQVTGSGQGIILFVEQQTTGGYPKIANIIAADLPSVGQLRPRDRIRYREVSFAEGRRAWVEQERLFRKPERLYA